MPLTSGNIRILEEKPIWGNITPLPASAVVEHVVASAGARPKDRDAIDKRIIREFLERKGRMIDSQNEVDRTSNPCYPPRHSKYRGYSKDRSILP